MVVISNVQLSFEFIDMFSRLAWKNFAVNDRDIIARTFRLNIGTLSVSLTRRATYCAPALYCVSSRPCSFQLISPKLGL